MEKILSVSVASYNVEKFIVQNIESFINTEVSDKIELLIIDDGSKDNTAKIAKEYEEKYPETVKLISQANAGPGSTVNTGLKNATGKYFRMVDGDDWVNKEDLVSYIQFLENNDADVVYTDFSYVDNDTFEVVPKHLEFDKKNVVLNYDDVCEHLSVSMHNVTYKTELIQNKIQLDNCFYTDMQYLLYPIKYAKTIAVLDKMIYMYRVSLSTQSMNINSMVRNKWMHEMVFHHLLEDFAKSKKEGLLSSQKINCIRHRLLIMAGAHLSIIIAQVPTHETKKELKDFIEYIKSLDSELYNQFINLKTVKVIRMSGYMLFNIVSKMHRKRENVAN